MDLATAKVNAKKELLTIIMIQLTIEKDQNYVIEECTTSFNACKLLQNAFNHQNIVYSFHTFKDILNLEMSSTESITNYQLRFRNT